MDFAILTNKYPKHNDYYRNAFVHQRNLQYLKAGHACKVLIVNNNNSTTYNYEGVLVIEGSYEEIKKELIKSNIDRILIHFINQDHMKLLKEIEFSIPTIIWIHGVEALSWRRRLFNVTHKGFLSYIFRNEKNLYRLRNFIKKAKNIRFIFVSNWMKDVMEKDVRCKIKDYEIIPNVVNFDVFNYIPKSVDQRNKLLVVRNFDSRKYANDITIKAIIMMSKKKYFNDLEISIYGQGRHYEKLTSDLKEYKNIKLYNTFLSQKDIAATHKNFGIFLCPTRQDSQGVSMCEAMASGLVPITSNNTAIPEFLNEHAGFLTDNTPENVVSSIEVILYNEQIFSKMSFESQSLVRKLCNQKDIINKELSYIKEELDNSY